MIMMTKNERIAQMANDAIKTYTAKVLDEFRDDPKLNSKIGHLSFVDFHILQFIAKALAYSVLRSSDSVSLRKKAYDLAAVQKLANFYIDSTRTLARNSREWNLILAEDRKNFNKLVLRLLADSYATFRYNKIHIKN